MLLRPPPFTHSDCRPCLPLPERDKLLVEIRKTLFLDVVVECQKGTERHRFQFCFLRDFSSEDSVAQPKREEDKRAVCQIETAVPHRCALETRERRDGWAGFRHIAG